MKVYNTERQDVSRKSEVIAMSPQNWWRYTMGYKEAGDLLLQDALGGGGQHFLVFPIIFMYRHYIELQLKEIIINNWLYLDISEGLPTYHNIEKLWSMCRDALHKMDEAVDPAFTKTKEYINEIISRYDALEADLKVFSQWDPNSEIFRYPIDKRGNPIVVNLKNINLKELEELISRISRELDGISLGAYDLLSQKEDMRSYEHE